MLVLVINAGSSSIKFQLFNMEDESCQVRGLVDRINTSESYLSYMVTNRGQFEKRLGAVDYYQALEHVAASLTDPTAGVLYDIAEISAVGHRVVHGGEDFVASTLITDEVERAIEHCAELAPLHNPPNLMGIRASRRLLPHIPQVAVFDTAFHQTLPEHAFSDDTLRSRISLITDARNTSHRLNARWREKSFVTSAYFSFFSVSGFASFAPMPMLMPFRSPDPIPERIGMRA